ncbi:phage protein Gp27 family protein [Pseudomonas chlororaphis]|uniref:phage protein Gp27 family protein n=1 Tax=Pseudomonas chlororaphis TaxID=587753 RepID=UPI00131A5EA9
MSRASTLYALPEAVRAELHRRYLEQKQLTVDEHLSWIVGQGYTVSRSSLHRYLVAYRDTMQVTKVDQEVARQSEEAKRLRCLELAAQSYRGDDQAELLSLAEDFLEWIQSAGTSRAPVA